MEKLILLVDDDEDELLLLKEAVAVAGVSAKCDWAPDADHAYRFLHLQLPDIILLDLNMPKTSGMVCLKHIRTLPFASQVPVILYSTSISEDTRRTALNLGAADCIEKAGSLDLLAKHLVKLLPAAVSR